MQKRNSLFALSKFSFVQTIILVNGASYAISFLLCFSLLSLSNFTVKKAQILSEEESLL